MKKHFLILIFLLSTSAYTRVSWANPDACEKAFWDKATTSDVRGIMEGSVFIGFNPGQKCSSGKIVHVAARYASLEILRAFLGNGVVVNIEDSNGDTPLDIARARGASDAIINLLEEYGAISSELLMTTGEGVCASNDYLIYSRPDRSVHILIRATGVLVKFDNVGSGSDGATNDNYRKAETDQYWNDQLDDDIPRIVFDLLWDHEGWILSGYFETWNNKSGYEKYHVDMYCPIGSDISGNYFHFAKNLKKMMF